MKRIGGFLLALCLQLIAQISSAQGPCNELQSIQQIQFSKPTQQSTMLEWATYQRNIYESNKQAARNIFNSYINDKLDPNFFEKCSPANEQYEELHNLLPSIFLDESIKKLSQSSPNSAVNRFYQVISSRIKNNNFILFKLAGHYKAAPAPTEMKGGFHRGEGSIFMNFTKIPPNEWLIILVHELTHSLDTQLSSAVGEYSKNEEVLKMVRSNKILSDLSKDEINELRRWIIAGLDRGLLAEYRAWAVTFKVYQDGLRERMWQRIDWLDDILQKKSANENLAAFTFRYLNPRFNSPKEWPFQSSPVKDVLEQIRRDLSGDQRTLSLSNLAEIIQ